MIFHPIPLAGPPFLGYPTPAEIGPPPHLPPPIEWRLERLDRGMRQSPVPVGQFAVGTRHHIHAGFAGFETALAPVAMIGRSPSFDYFACSLGHTNILQADSGFALLLQPPVQFLDLRQFGTATLTSDRWRFVQSIK